MYKCAHHAYTGDMSPESTTIRPEDVRNASISGGTPDWLSAVAEYVEKAAAEGDLVTLTSAHRMLTPAQVAEATGMSRSTISRRISSGALHAVKVGNRNRIPYEEFERFWHQTMADVVDLTADDIRSDLFSG
ncbi:helix-turn-helix domain-containing protein [Corynebacterium variabile]|uniref:helix-turn-helix domain-containing protein n=1 Tax=Corynebacterium variabile TaxID=1727 RepID=UPI003A8E4186